MTDDQRGDPPQAASLPEVACLTWVKDKQQRPAACMSLGSRQIGVPNRFDEVRQ